MANRELEWESTLTAERCEYAYGLANQMFHARAQGWADIGLRAARARDPKLLKALEKMAEHATQMDDDQRGQTRRSSSTEFKDQRYTTVTQMCQAAYKMVDQGTPVPHLQWIYAGAAWLAGLNPITPWK